MFLFRGLFARGFVVALTLALTACGGGTSPSGNIVPQSSQANTAHAQTTQASATSTQAVAATNATLPTPCTKIPVKSLQVSTTTITMSPSTSTSFQACTQYSGPYTITATPSTQTIITFPKTVNPTDGVNGIFSATINVTAGAVDGTVTLTVRDKKGNKQQVVVTVIGPLSLSCLSNIANAGSTTSCSVSNPGYAGTYTFAASSTSGNCTATLSGYVVGDTSAEACTVTLTPTSGSENAVQQTVQFVGPLGLSCPGTGVVGNTGVSCTVTNQNYPNADTYTITAKTGSCSPGTLSSGSFTVTDSTAESCTVQIAANSGSETAQTATVSFVGPLTLNCSSPAAVGATGSSCTYGDPGYTGNYNFTKTGSCTVSAATATTLTITDATAELCDATITEASSPSQTISANIQYVGPLTLSCPNASATGTAVTCSYSYPGFGGTLTASTDKTTCSPNTTSPTPVTGGSFTVNDTSDETCTATLTPSTGPEAAVSAPITFSTVTGGVGPLALNCPSSGTVNVATSCSFTNPGYAGSYTSSTVTGIYCTTGTVSGSASGNFSVNDTASESCTVKLTPTTGTESAAQATIFFNSSGGGGGGGGCSKPRIVHGKKNGKVIGFVLQC